MQDGNSAPSSATGRPPTPLWLARPSGDMLTATEKKASFPPADP